MLEIDGIGVVYDRSIKAVQDVSLRVEAGTIVALLGPNGVGKSTLLKAISGVLTAEKGELVAGAIRFEGKDLRGKAPDEIVGLGIVQVPEGRRLFVDLTVEENLLTGAFCRSRREIKASLAEIYGWFPRLAERRTIDAGYLSGGEQQMVALGRALMAKPRLLLLDEPSLGLAPQIVEQIFGSLRSLRDEEGITILLVEQNAAKALSIADHGHVIEGGKVVMAGTREELMANDLIRHFYLGLSSSGARRSFRQTDPGTAEAGKA